MARAGYAPWDEDDAYDMVVERSSRHARKKRPPFLRMALMSTIIVTGLAYFAQNRQPGEQEARKAVPSAVLIAPPPMWNPVSATPALYAIDRGASSLTLEARQHTSGAREDTLVLGRFGEARHARITLVQGSAEPARSFFVDIVRRAAQAGLAVAREAQSRVVRTKFGPVEAAAMSLAGASEQDCQAFRFSDQDTAFGFQGWLCGSGAASVDEAQLACFIDGIALTGAGSPSLKALFVRAERGRVESCGPDARTASIPVRPPLLP